MEIPSEIVAALIAAIVALGTVAIRDFWLGPRNQRLLDKKTAKKVYKLYSEPLARSLSDLMWRLDEVFRGASRGAYLTSKISHSEYAQYKKISTIYRLGVVLGWIRSLEKELSFLKADRSEQSQKIQSDIKVLQSALADGNNVELRRVNGLAKEWGLKLTDDQEKLDNAGVRLDEIVDEHLHKSNIDTAHDLSDTQQNELLSQVYDELFRIAEPLDFKKEPRDLKSKASIALMSFREAWIYRNWQQAIGDFMTERVEGHLRKYEIMGYMAFEETYRSEIPANIWLSRLKSPFDELNIVLVDEFDARAVQLREVFISVVKLLDTLTLNDPSLGVLMTGCVDLIKEIKSDSAFSQEFETT